MTNRRRKQASFALRPASGAGRFRRKGPSGASEGTHSPVSYTKKKTRSKEAQRHSLIAIKYLMATPLVGYLRLDR